MKIQMFIYPGMTLLDLVGPLQAWTAWPGTEFQLVAQTVGRVDTDSALSVYATHSFQDAWSAPDILFVPGGTAGTFALLNNKGVITFLRQQGRTAGWITSVCTGSLVLAAAGLLKGYRATSHWAARDMLAEFGAEVSNERWVIDRNRASGGGVTAGIDFGLAMIAHITGDDEVARRVQLALEYSPKPPFNSGTPEEASAETLKAVLERFQPDGGKAIAAVIAAAVTQYQQIQIKNGLS